MRTILARHQPRSEQILSAILFLRSRRVLLDFTLAEFYGVATATLIQAVRRHQDRFPPEFLFQLTSEETALLRASMPFRSGWGGRRKLPYAFTEHGVLMLASVLRSRTAAKVSISVVRTFMQLRELLGTNLELARKLEELEKRYDKQFAVVFEAIRELMTPATPADPEDKIGFRALLHGHGESGR